MVITKDGATRYHIYLVKEAQMRSSPCSAKVMRRTSQDRANLVRGIAWIVILCHQTFEAQGLAPVWGWDKAMSKTASKPFSALMEQVISFKPMALSRPSLF